MTHIFFVHLESICAKMFTCIVFWQHLTTPPCSLPSGGDDPVWEVLQGGEEVLCLPQVIHQSLCLLTYLPQSQQGVQAPVPGPGSQTG